MDATGSGKDYDAVVVDLGLPDRDGLTIVAEIRVLFPALPVVIASGRNATALVERFADDRRIAVLGKPFQAEALDEVLERLGVTGVPRDRR